MKPPRMRSDVTKEWVEHILNEFENRSNPGYKVTLQSWTIGDATKKGDGYSGDLVKLDSKGIVAYDRGEHEKEYHHIIKFSNPDPFAQEFIKYSKTRGNEIKMYSRVIDEFNKFQAELSENQFPVNMPTHIYSRDTDKESILVMENMKVLDYSNKSKKDLLGLDEAQLVLEQLARLHGISYAYHQKYNFLKKYPTYENEFIKQFMIMGLDRLIDYSLDILKIMSNDDGEYGKIMNKIKAYKPHLVKRINESFNKRNMQIQCLNHGDPWNNNILVKQSESSKEEKVILVDWEASHWNTSAFDLVYFMAGSTTPEMRKYHLDDLLQHYHSHFTNVTTTLGTPIPEWGVEQLKAEFNVMSAWRFVKSLGFTMILSEASKDFEFAKFADAPPSKFKKGMAKVFAPLLIKPSVLKFAFSGIMKKMQDSVLKEMKSKSNKDLNERALACIIEAEQNGLFDIPSK